MKQWADSTIYWRVSRNNPEYLKENGLVDQEVETGVIRALPETALAYDEPPLSMLSLCETASGGVGRYQENLAALAGHGIACRVVLPAADRHILGPDADVLTFHRKKRDLRGLLNFVLAFLAARKHQRPDLYFFNSTFSLLPLLILRLLRDRTPAIYCAHCWAIATQAPDGLKARLVRAVEGNLCGLADLVVNVAASDAATAKRFGYRGHQIVVDQAVDSADPHARDDLFERGASDEIHLLFVGRFDHQKGLDLLLPAFSRARERNPSLHLHLVGGAVRDGDAPAQRDGVTNHGWANPDQIDSFYKSADALIVPSRWEGMPLVVLESLRNDRPVFASTGCGMGDFLERYECGASFELAEDPLTTRLAGLRRKDLVALQVPAQRAFRANFTLDRFAAEMSGHIRALIKGPNND
jgi:glycosyltransferase involved in cell wall biosynthesis